MIINPDEIKKLGVVKPIYRDSIQQNGIDLNVKTISNVTDGGILACKDKELPIYEDLEPNAQGFFELTKGFFYNIQFEQFVNIPPNMCALIIHRSSLRRIGATLLSGWFDSGFKHTAGAFLHAHANIKIEQGARIAQIIFFKAQPASLYSGQYQFKE